MRRLPFAMHDGGCSWEGDGATLNGRVYSGGQGIQEAVLPAPPGSSLSTGQRQILLG